MHQGSRSWPQKTPKRGLQVCKTLGRRQKTQKRQGRRSQPLRTIRKGIQTQEHHERIVTTRALGRESQPKKTLGRGLITQKHLEEHHQENTNAKNIMKNSKIQTNPTTTWQNLMMTPTCMIIRKIRFLKTLNSI